MEIRTTKMAISLPSPSRGTPFSSPLWSESREAKRLLVEITPVG